MSKIIDEIKSYITASETRRASYKTLMPLMKTFPDEESKMLLREASKFEDRHLERLKSDLEKEKIAIECWETYQKLK
jgi:hypothetical protein